MGSVGLEGKFVALHTTRPRRVASRRFCSSDRRSRFSVRRATAMPCMARFSLISLGVCMLERVSTLRQVTQVTARKPKHTQFLLERTSSDLQDRKRYEEAHNRKTPGANPQQLRSILSQGAAIEKELEVRRE